MKHFKLPDLGEGLQEAEIVEWHVKAGDSVRADQRLVSVETAKALVDIPAPYDGVVGKLFGAEGDINLTGANDTFAPWKFSNPWFGTVRGRAGYAFNNILFYGTGGLAFGGLRGETFGLSESHTSLGWTLGAGAEFGLAQNWTAKIEYLYIDLDSSNFVITGAKNDYRFGVVRAGINFHF